jgi:uncharacterized protein YhfF
MWRRYLEHLGESPETTEKRYGAWHFCDNEKDADELAELVLRGQKRATASLKRSYEHESEPLPAPGDLSIITDFSGLAKCIIRTRSVEIMPFREVPAEFAYREGEGDRSLEHWRAGHWGFFSRELEEIGEQPTEEMEVICEEFEVVWPPQD